MIGKTISHYKIVEKLGEGGMGKVYKAEDIRLKRFVALKFLPSELTDDKEAKSRFIQEAQAASALEHQNICTIYDIKETEEGQTYIVMGFYEGGTLADKIKAGRLTIEEALDVAMGIAGGLSKAHHKGIVHRDLKPSNMLFDEEGQIKIIDFGLAKLAGGANLTETGKTMGTVAYMSPEQASAREVDHRTDIWSLGVVLYEMLTGKTPFKAECHAATLHSIINKTLTPPSQHREELPGQLDQIISKALEKDLNRRYQSIDVLLSDFKILHKCLRLGVPETMSISISREEQLHSIAVLSFTDMSPGRDQEYFCDGIAEEILNKLARIPGLKVAARTSAFSFKGQAIKISEIGRQLNVCTVLEGSVRVAGERIRVTAQLINVADGYHIWSDSYDRELKDVFSIQDEISLSIVDALKLELGVEEKRKLTKRNTENIEAYNHYLKGRFYWSKRYEVSFQQSIVQYNAAVEIDPEYALAYAGLADTYATMSLWGMTRPSEAYGTAKEAAQRALGIDPTLSEAHTSIAYIKFIFEWDWAAAESEFIKAIELNDNNAQAHFWYSFFLSLMERHDEAIKQIEYALMLDPLTTIMNVYHGCCHSIAGDQQKARGIIEKAIEMDPTHYVGYWWMSIVYLNLDKPKKALAWARKGVEIKERPISMLKSCLGYILGKMGKRDKAKQILDELLELSKKRHVSALDIATVYSGLGDMNKTIEWVYKALEERECLILFIKTMPWWEGLRSESAYDDLIEKIGLDK